LDTPLRGKAKYHIQNYCQGNGKIIGINFFAGSDARFWGTDKFIKLIDYLYGKNFRLIPISDTNNLELAKQICPDKKIFCGSFDELAALVSKLDYLITPDTSLVHLCSIYNIPAFIFFVKYRLSGSLWTPYKTYYESVITEESTLKNISFEEALIKIKKFLNINE
jgi:ADP-heptose:LPS heptosyltransferase